MLCPVRRGGGRGLLHQDGNHRKDEETGETTTYLEDFVYAFADGGLLGIEPVGSVENVSGTLMLAENDKVLDILLGGAAE